MRTRLPASLALSTVALLTACPSDTTDPITPTSTLGLTTETGDGDGDLSETGTAEGDGDGDPGDGDGDGDPGDGDGDGDPGDGDGDPCTPGSEGCPCDLDMCDPGLSCVDGTCALPSCGDGIVDPGEECDVGNETMFCDGDCTYATCGDGYWNMLSEECDDGNNASDDGCVGACLAAACGDGYLYAGVEECDDANMEDTDECKNDCTSAICGDSVIWDGVEECDDGNMDATDACNDQCLNSFCGDGVIWQGMETCDDGNMDQTDDCPACEPAVCGDGFIWSGQEECDDGNNVDDDFCNNSCILTGAGISCSDILTNMSVWGLTASGVDLRAYTSSTLHWIGCPDNGCAANTFYCQDDVNAGTLQFGTTSSGAMRAVVDPNDQDGDTIPNGYQGCCSANSNSSICNAPDSANNGVNVNMVTALCNSLGYAMGTIIREVNNNSCPEPHAVNANGQVWDSDWVNSQGFGAEYLCHQN